MYNAPRALSEERPALVSDVFAVETIINTESTRDMYKANMEKYRKKIFDYNDKYFQVCVTTYLYYEEDPYIHINDLKIPYKIQLILKNQYDLSDLFT